MHFIYITYPTTDLCAIIHLLDNNVPGYDTGSSVSIKTIHPYLFSGVGDALIIRFFLLLLTTPHSVKIILIDYLE